MSRRPSPWKLAVEALERIDRKMTEILQMQRIPRTVRQIALSVREEDVVPVLRRNGRR